MKTKLIIIIILIIIALAIAILSLNITGQATKSQDSYSFTKAICNESNYCQDYQIKCIDNQLESINPITGSVVQQSPLWEDPRDEKTKNKLCS